MLFRPPSARQWKSKVSRGESRIRHRVDLGTEIRLDLVETDLRKKLRATSHRRHEQLIPVGFRAAANDGPGLASAPRRDLAPARLSSAHLVAAANKTVGQVVVRTIRVLPPGPATSDASGTAAAPPAAGASAAEASVRTRETASPGYRRALAAFQASRPALAPRLSRGSYDPARAKPRETGKSAKKCASCDGEFKEGQRKQRRYDAWRHLPGEPRGRCSRSSPARRAGRFPAREGQLPVLDPPPLPRLRREGRPGLHRPGRARRQGSPARARPRRADRTDREGTQGRHEGQEGPQRGRPAHRAGTASMVPYYRLMKISCPVRHAKPDAQCALPAGSHQARRDILSRHLDGGGRRRRLR